MIDRATGDPEVELLAGFDALPSLRSAWDEVFEARPHQPSVSFEWTAAMAAHHVRRGDRCWLAVIRRRGRIDGVVPLVKRRVSALGVPVRIVGPLSEDYNTHSDLLLREPDGPALGALLEALDRLDAPWDCFRLSRMPEDGAVAASLAAALATSPRPCHVRAGLAAYVLDLPPTFADYLETRSAKFRNYLKRIDRKLRAAGPLTVHEASTPGTLDAALEAVLQIERASWKQDHGSSISAVGRQQGFYRDFGRAAAARGRLHLQWLTLDDRPVAHNLGYIDGGVYYYLKTSYDAALRSLSPSTWLRARLVQDLITRGVTRLDFPGEPYEWERQWADRVCWRQVMTIYASTVTGRLLHLAEHIRHRHAGPRSVTHVDPRTGRVGPGMPA